MREHNKIFIMLNRIKDFIKRIFFFWKGFLSSSDKKSHIRENIGELKTQVIVILVAVVSVFVILQTLKPAVRGVCRLVLQSDADDAMSMFGKRVVGVEAKKVVSGVTLRQVRSIGILKANAEVVIKSELSGKIKEISFIEGGEVEKDQELIKFEDELFIAERDKADAAYVLAKSEFDRMKKLHDQKVGSTKDYDKALAQMNEAAAQLESATYQLSKTVIRAPFSGTIGIMKVSPGNIVQQHTELVTLVDSSSVKVEFMVPAKFVDDVAVGQDVDITIDSFKDRKFSGSVDAIDSEVDTKNHSILVRAVVPNTTGVLKHGLFSNVTLTTGEKSDVILVDEDALDREGAIEFVWAIDEKGRAYRRRVLTGARDPKGVEVIAGLKAGDLVVVAGHLKLSDGAIVKILNAKDGETQLDQKDGESDGLVDQELEDSDKAPADDERDLNNGGEDVADQSPEEDNDEPKGEPVKEDGGETAADEESENLESQNEEEDGDESDDSEDE